MAIKPKITYCLWFNGQVEQASDFYQKVFSDAKTSDVLHSAADTPSGKAGTVLTAGFEVGGQHFLLLNGGDQFHVNPSISFMVHCDTAEEVNLLWKRLSEGGKALMPLDAYPFSDRYGWVADRYGVSWQLILPKQQAPQRVMPSMMFVNEVYGKAEEAISYYASIFHDTKTGTVARYPAGMESDREGTIMYSDFMLEGQWFAAMDSGHPHRFHFDEGVSFVVHCDNQQEIDYYWERLGRDGREVQCGWLHDKYGVAWQIVPDILPKLLEGDDHEKAKRVMEAMMKMVKLDITGLEQA